MSLKTKSLIILLIISMFILSSCEVYETLYGNSGAQNASEESPSDEIPEEMEDASDKNQTQETPSEELPVGEEETEEAPEEESEEEIEEPEEVPIDDAPRDENPFVVSVEETELVDLAPSADDPDSDAIAFTFTSPLDDSGKWQTAYGDNGEYTVTVTASDGELTTTRDVLIIVNKKEESPTIDSSKPSESALSMEETDYIEFSVESSDLNNDPLDYEWKLDGVPVGANPSFEFQSTYDDAGSHTVKVDITDGTSSASRIWSIDVANVNRLPQMAMLDDIDAKETDIIVITVEASDDDYDSIEYSISDSRFKQDGNEFTWETDYSSAGTYEVTVKASDGQDTTEQTIMVTVDNVNRPPMIKDIGQN